MKNRISRWLFLLIFVCLSSAGLQAQSVIIDGLSPIGEYQGDWLYVVEDPSITVKMSNSYYFNYIKVDKTSLSVSNYSSQKGYSLDVSIYLDGKIHKLQLIGNSYSAVCYFGNYEAVHGSNIDGILYSVDGKAASVVGAFYEIETADIPSITTINEVEYPVTSISSKSFYGCENLREVTIPESITSIGENAFVGCNNLKSLTFNATKCSSCGSSSNPSFPSSISTLVIGDGVTAIPGYFLYGGSSLESVTIPNSVTTIGDYAFLNSKELKSVTLGSGLRYIGPNAFSYKYDSGSDYYKIKIAKAFWLGNTPPTNSDAIQASINYVANDQYSFFKKVKYQFLSSKFLVDGTYYIPVSPSERTCDVVDCEYSLQNGDIVIGDKVINRGVELTVLNINDYAFYKNQTIKSLKNSNKGSLGNYAFRDCGTLESVQAMNIGSIGQYAFFGCLSLNNVRLGNDISSIGDDAFDNCSSLPTITLPDNVSSIGNYAFYGCSKLATVNIGTGITTISQYAFGNCSALNNLSIPNNVKTIGDNVFSGCTSLANVRFEDAEIQDEIQETSPTTFEDWISTNRSNSSTSDKTFSFSVVSGTVLSFDYTVSSESGYDYLIVKINGTEVLKDSGNKTSSYTKTFNASENVTLYLSYSKDSYYSSGQDLAKVYNIKLSNNGPEVDFLQLGSNKYYYSDNNKPLFADCPLDEVYLGRKLSYNTSSSYGYSPFYRNTSLRSVEITDAETEVYDNEFYGCTNLQTLKIGNGVKSIGKWAFSGCSSLDYFSAGYQVETIGQEAFSDCTGLKNYYSFSIIPPVCGTQALDDINKWDCTLHVPAESSDEYMAADQWKDFFFISETDAVLAESLRFNVETLEGLTGETFQLVAEFTPANVTRKTLAWESSNPAVASVDSEGLVSFLSEGEAVISAMTLDGSGVEASIDVIVRVKEPELGDSNANGSVNIADVVNIANYAIGNEVEHFNQAASDVNKDGKITMADATGTVRIILEQDVVAQSAAARVKGLAVGDVLIVEDFEAEVGGVVSLGVSLDDSMDYVALQADVVVPEGMTLMDVKLGERAEGTHSLTVRRIDSRTMRIALFDLENRAFADRDDALLVLEVRVDAQPMGAVRLMNAIAADNQANEYALTSRGGQSADMSGIEAAEGGKVRIETSTGVISVYNAEGMEVSIYAVDGTMITRFTSASDKETRRVCGGVYVVAVGTEVEKVVVK